MRSPASAPPPRKRSSPRRAPTCPLPHPRPPGVMGQVRAQGPPVRRAGQGRRHRQGQPLARRHHRQSCHRRPPKYTLAQRREIKKIAKSRPVDYDLPFSTWSLSKLAEFLVAEGVVDDIEVISEK